MFSNIFTSKFTPKKTPPRKADTSSITRVLDSEQPPEDLGLEVGPILLHLGNQDISFDDGQWTPETGAVSGPYKDNVKLRRHVQKLEDENNMLKLKCEILLNMLTETTAESHLHEKEIEQLKHKVDVLKSSHTDKMNY